MSVEKKSIYFLRWGNLNPVKHKEARKADDDSWVHIAPCYKGIYAFPQGYVEPFLLGGNFGRKFIHYLKKDGKIVKDSEFYDFKNDFNIRPEYLKLLKKLKIRVNSVSASYSEEDDTCYMVYREPPKHFKYEGDIWHHLGNYVDKKNILDEKHGWYKTSFKVYLNALHKCDVSERFQSYMINEKDKRHGNPHIKENSYEKALSLGINKVLNLL